MSDSLFKTMFYNEKRIKYSAKLLSYFIDIPYEKLLNNIKLSKGELDKDKEMSKSSRSDYVSIINDTKINIEINNNSSQDTMERNLDYAFKLYSLSNKIGDKYKYNQVIQINFNNFYFEGNEKIIDICTLKNEDGICFNNKLVIIQLYIPKLVEKWYNEEKLDERERFILSLVEHDKNKSLELMRGDSILKEYIDEVEYAVEYDNLGEAYDHEKANREEERLIGREEGKKEGKKEGKEEGIQQTTNLIAKKFKENGIDIKIISECTGLSCEEINIL